MPDVLRTHPCSCKCREIQFILIALSVHALINKWHAFRKHQYKSEFLSGHQQVMPNDTQYHCFIFIYSLNPGFSAVGWMYFLASSATSHIHGAKLWLRRKTVLWGTQRNTLMRTEFPFFAPQTFLHLDWCPNIRMSEAQLIKAQGQNWGSPWRSKKRSSQPLALTSEGDASESCLSPFYIPL